ncbi:cytosolic carboxypeptidase 2 isoform X2 [Esox lucius]|uniref:cytosolic carboxypeptidase 2 isoform X2 n=1 Tax=Esox lucius TaxID=8010 RepID=UPI0014773FFE|nr:cytosolic carboxypeptidase 2 isoform X2 [Esox lucius]
MYPLCNRQCNGDDNGARDGVREGMCRHPSSYSSFDQQEEGEEGAEEDEEQVKASAEVLNVEEESFHKSKGVSPLPRTTQLVFEIQSGRAVPRLREPRHLYGVSGHLSQTLPRWPRECEVIPEEIRHIDWVPPCPEPLCSQVNNSVWRRPESEEEGTVVYDTQRDKENYFRGSCVGSRGAVLTQAAMSLTGPEDTTLLFEARFESGNLLKATQVGEFEYELSLRSDLYTERHRQWFYFRVRNTRAGVLYHFTITNLLKAASLYEEGQQPLLYSEEKARVQAVGWHRVGQQVSYRPNGQQHANQPHYSLSWTFHFPYDQDTCYLAHCYPYTYSNLWTHLSQIEQDPRCSRFCKVRTLCRSLAGNLVPVLTVTKPSQLGDKDGSYKPAVVLTARIHPGETNSSWVMRGIVNFLLGDSPDAALLREAFVFKLVPMLNPDGVIVGNNRCSLTGRDLNRNYKSLLRESFPTVWATRTMVQRLCEERKVLLYCDLHGHSRKHNVFSYGCKNPHERIFPLMLSKNCPDMFSFESCKFKVQRSKEGTGRVAMWRLGVLNSFTLETSLCGANFGKRKGTHFSTQDFEMLGAQFCDTLLDYCDPGRTKYSMCVRELHAIIRRPADLLVDLERTDASVNDHEASTSGSNSSESDGPPVHLQNFNKVKPRKKLKSKKERNRSHLVKVRESLLNRDNNVKGTSEKSKHRLKALKAPPVAPRKEASRWRERPLVPPETSTPDLKLEYLQHVMAEYVRTRMHLRPGPTHQGYNWGSGQCQKPPHPPPRLVPSFLCPTRPPSQLPRHLEPIPRRHLRLPVLADVATPDKALGRLSPVQWRGPKSLTAPASVQLGSDRLQLLSLSPGRDLISESEEHPGGSAGRECLSLQPPSPTITHPGTDSDSESCHQSKYNLVPARMKHKMKKQKRTKRKRLVK